MGQCSVVAPRRSAGDRNELERPTEEKTPAAAIGPQRPGTTESETMSRRSDNTFTALRNALAALIGYPSASTQGVLTRRLVG